MTRPEDKPGRVQLRRTKGWKMPPNTVKVARPTRWGNPFTILEFGLPLALDLYRNALMGFWSATGIPDRKVDRAYQLHTDFRKRFRSHPGEEAWGLRGMNLACFCGPRDRCHADILLEIANG